MKKLWHGYVLLLVFLLTQPLKISYGTEFSSTETAIPILLYHRMGPVVADAMTVKTSVFASQLEYLQSNGYTVAPKNRSSEKSGRKPSCFDNGARRLSQALSKGFRLWK
jgi:hypothetical protein